MYKLTINKIDYTDKLDIRSVSFSKAIDSYDFTFKLYLQTKEGLEKIEALQLAEVEFFKDDKLLVGGILWDIKPSILQRKQINVVRTQYLVECTINSYNYLTSKILTKGGPADISTPDFTDTSQRIYFQLNRPDFLDSLKINSQFLSTSGNKFDSSYLSAEWYLKSDLVDSVRVIVMDRDRNIIVNTGKLEASTQVVAFDLEQGEYTVHVRCYDENSFFSIDEFPISINMDSDFSYFVPYQDAGFDSDPDNVSDSDITITKPANYISYDYDTVTQFQVKWKVSKGIIQNAYRINVYDNETLDTVYTTGKVRNGNTTAYIPIADLVKGKVYYFEVIIFFEEDVDLNNAEMFFYRYAQTYLKPKNIYVSKRNIDTNLTIGEIADDELDPKPYLKDVLDYLADKTKSSWNISANKQFTVKSGKTSIKTYENRFNEVSGENDFQSSFFDLKMEKAGDDIVNRITVKGSSEHESMDEQYIDEEGRLTITVDNIEAQERLKLAGLGDGVMEVIEENNKITTVEELKRYAEEYVAKYGDGLKKISFSTYSDLEFSPGDFIGISAETIGFDNILCMVDKISYNFESLIDEDLSMRKDIECTIRKDNNPLPNWTTIFKKNSDSTEKTKGNTSQNTQSGLLSESVDIQMMEDVLTEVFIEILEA